MRLIDADALLDELKKTGRYFQAKFDIENAPTVEPERPQGEWLTFSTNHSIIQCSECTALLNNLRADIFKDKIGKMNFCPNCGARMKEVNSNG